MTSLVDDFMELFAGRTDVIGTNEGGSLRCESENDFRTRIEKHLERGGGYAIGVYPVDAHNMVHWGCVDWDDGYERSWPDALNTHNILKALGVTSWIERSRSKGYHLWVFAEQWVPAKTMRHALIAACELVDAPIREVNPKQVSLDAGAVGNYVRVPYPGMIGRKFGYVAPGMQKPENEDCNVPQTISAIEAQIWDDVHVACGLGPFIKMALDARTPTAKLEELAARYTPPATIDPGDLDDTVHELDPMLSRRLKPLTFLVVKDGPLPDEFTGKIDRSAGLFKLGRQLWEDGNVSYQEAWDVMCAADRNWGRYLDEGRPDVLASTLRKAWSQA